MYGGSYGSMYFSTSSDIDTSSVSSFESYDRSSLNSSSSSHDIFNRNLCFHDDSLQSLCEFDGPVDSVTVKDTESLSSDLQLILSLPEMCDVTFLVGENQTPVYGVKAVLATRSKVFYQMILSHQNVAKQGTNTPKKGNPLISRLKTLQKKCSSPGKSPRKPTTVTSSSLTIPIEKFDPDTFRRVILYLHTGSVNISFRSVIGVMNAANTYGLSNLREACFDFAQQFINLDTALPLLASAEIYSDFKWTKILLTKILEFIAEKAEDILRLSDFEHLSQKTAAMILQNPGLRVRDEVKQDAASNWSRRQSPAQSELVKSLKYPEIDVTDISQCEMENQLGSLTIETDDSATSKLLQKSSAHNETDQENTSLSVQTTARRMKQFGNSLFSSPRRWFNKRRSSSLSKSGLSRSTELSDSGFLSSFSDF